MQVISFYCHGLSNEIYAGDVRIDLRHLLSVLNSIDSLQLCLVSACDVLGNYCHIMHSAHKKPPVITYSPNK